VECKCLYTSNNLMMMDQWAGSRLPRWFRDEGVQLKVEDDGRCFPVTDDSATIVDCLRVAATRSGVEVWMSSAVKAITPLEGGGFRVVIESGGDSSGLYCDRVLLATGSSRAGHR